MLRDRRVECILVICRVKSCVLVITFHFGSSGFQHLCLMDKLSDCIKIGYYSSLYRSANARVARKFDLNI